VNGLFEKVGSIFKTLYYAGALVLFAMMILTAADVAGRYLFHKPIQGVYELTEFMMVCVVFLSLAYGQSVKGHAKVSVLVGRFPRRIQGFIQIANYALALIVLSFMAWKSVERGFEVFVQKDCSGTLGIPVYPFLFIVALGCGGMCVELLRDIAERMRGPGKS
jgi:TRAP-type C4-dicarboxylate transport system permease small subunit